jgi:hypothetical protein
MTRRSGMRKILALALVAIGIAVGLPALSGAAPEDVKGPGCLDIVDGLGGYTTTGRVTVQLFLAAPSCKQFTYTLYVTDLEGRVLTSFATKGEGLVDGTDFPIVLSTTEDPVVSTVCLYTTTSAGQHVFDRGPDTDFLADDQLCPQGSADFVRGGAGAFRAFN